MIKMLNYINGALVEPQSKQYLDNHNPSTGEVYSLCPDSDERDIEAAYQAAEAAFEGWSNYTSQYRRNIMLRIAALLEKNLDKFAEAESMDQGKPLWLSKNGEIPRAISNIHFFGTAIEHFASEAHPMGNHAINYTTRTPIGVVGCISPWNLPLYLFTWKIAPALAAGNCVVAKPSEMTPVTASMLGDICNEAGLPAGVLNIIHGTGPAVGEAIVRHEEIKAIYFTGSTAVGKRIAGICAEQLKKASLELGGKNPVIIFADCDYEEMMETTIRSSFSNQGQICLCGSRILVQKSIYEKFKTAFVEKTKQLTVGDPLDERSRQGSIVSKVHFDKVMNCIVIAKEE